MHERSAGRLCIHVPVNQTTRWKQTNKQTDNRQTNQNVHSFPSCLFHFNLSSSSCFSFFVSVTKSKLRNIIFLVLFDCTTLVVSPNIALQDVPACMAPAPPYLLSALQAQSTSFSRNFSNSQRWNVYLNFYLCKDYILFRPDMTLRG